jgi:hypothetical protein
VARRNDEVTALEAEDFLYGTHYGIVGRNTPAKRRGPGQNRTSTEIAVEAACDRQAETGENVCHGRCLLLQVNHIALGKDAAASRNSGLGPALGDQARELLFDADA